MPDEPDLMSFAQKEGGKPYKIDRYFDQRPEAAQQVLEGAQRGLPIAQMARWLREYHDYTMQSEALRRWIVRRNAES